MSKRSTAPYPDMCSFSSVYGLKKDVVACQCVCFCVYVNWKYAINFMIDLKWKSSHFNIGFIAFSSGEMCSRLYFRLNTHFPHILTVWKLSIRSQIALGINKPTVNYLCTLSKNDGGEKRVSERLKCVHSLKSCVSLLAIHTENSVASIYLLGSF